MADIIDKMLVSVRSHYNADVYLYVGGIDPPTDRLFHLWLKNRLPKRQNVLLMLRTLGGSADVGYKISRRLQISYNTLKQHKIGSPTGTFYIFVGRECKSAGTLLALGANEIIMSNEAELGPLDVQLRKQDEVGERTSGLAPIQAMGSLRTQAIDHFKQIFWGLRFDEDLAFSTKMAADIATRMTAGLLEPIYAQIDPIRMAEIERHLTIANAYGSRLSQSGNLKDDALGKLLASYPSHSFVIDKMEAETLFNRVTSPTGELSELFDFFCSFTENHFLGKDKPFVIPLDTDDERQMMQGVKNGPEPAEANGKNPSTASPGDGTDNQDGNQ